MSSLSRRPDGKWHARFRPVPGGPQVSAVRARKVDAQRWLNEQTAALVTGQYVHPTAGKLTVRDYAEQWRAAQVHRPTTAAHVETMLRRHVYPHLGDRPLASVRPTDVQQLVKALSASLAPSTVGVVHRLLAGVFKAAVRDRRIASSPCEGTRLPRVHREQVEPLALKTVRALEDAVPAAYRALITLAAGTGLRQGEALGLTLDRVDFLRRTLTVDRQLILLPGQPPFLGPPKTAASVRTIPLPQVVLEALAAHLAAGATSVAPDGFMFTTEAGLPVRRTAFSAQVWVPATKAAGTTATFHALRHFYASLLIRHGESVKTVQARLGHASAAETLDTYSHLWPDSDDRTRVAVDTVLGAAEDQLRTGTGVTP